MLDPLDPLFQRYLAAEAEAARGCLLWIEGDPSRLICEPEHCERRLGSARLVYLPRARPEEALALARAWCEAARAEGRSFHVGLALTQDRPLFLQTLMEVAREGAAVASHQGLTGLAHSELYDWWQRRWERQQPNWRLPLRGETRTEERVRPGEPTRPNTPAPTPGATPEHVERLQRRLDKLIAELRAKDEELAALRAELEAQSSDQPMRILFHEEARLDARRRALFAVIFEENQALQAQLRRAN